MSTENSGLADDHAVQMIRGPELTERGGMVGFGTVELFGADGERKHFEEFRG